MKNLQTQIRAYILEFLLLNTSFTLPFDQPGNDFDVGLCLPGPTVMVFIINHIEVSIAFVKVIIIKYSVLIVSMIQVSLLDY